MHAYMIIAHNQFELLEKLIKTLDNPNNNFYIHIDSKVKDFDFGRFKSLTNYSSVIFTDDRVSITWGDYSLVKAEMLLLKTAVSDEDYDNPYTYYHLLSGVDLPIKSNDEIYSFFENNSGKEFVHFTSNDVDDSSVSRLRYYHILRGKRTFINKVIAQVFLRIQKLLGVNRLKKMNLRVQKGSNWFSITGDFAKYIVSSFPSYEKLFKFCYCGDEVFVQTLLLNSPFKDNLFMPNCDNNHFACARLIDWSRGNPYVWRLDDYDEIKGSSCMFARKFDINVDRKIIELLTD